MTREEEISKAARCLKKVQKIGIFEVQSANQCLKDAALQDAFIKGAEWADANPRWISANEELPPKNEAYLAFWQHLGVGRYRFVKANEKVGKSFKEHITHWMPLPQKPSSSEKPNN